MNDPALFPDSSGNHRKLLIMIQVGALIAVVVWLVAAREDGPQVALIPTLVTVVASRFFGKKKDDEDGALGEHPAVRFMLGALTTGGFDDADDIVAEDFAVYANGYPVVSPDEADVVEQLTENIGYWRSAVPDLSIELYDEISQKEPDKTDGIAVRYVMSGTIQTDDREQPFETEVAAFVKVVDHKLTEWRVVADTAFVDEVRATMGLTETE
jgi:ketosteroid isomerase-like protein